MDLTIDPSELTNVKDRTKGSESPESVVVADATGIELTSDPFTSWMNIVPRTLMFMRCIPMSPDVFC